MALMPIKWATIHPTFLSGNGGIKRELFHQIQPPPFHNVSDLQPGTECRGKASRFSGDGEFQNQSH
jgi:hypothetical protein